MQVRLPEDLSVQVRELAEEQKRSVSQMTAILVEDALSRRGTPVPVSPRTVVLPEAELRDSLMHPQFRGPDPK
jgi:hypothetical protein